MRLPQFVLIRSHIMQPKCGSLNKVPLKIETQLDSPNKAT